MVTPAWPLPGGGVINPYNTLLPPLSLLQPLFQDGALLAALRAVDGACQPPPNLPWDSAAWGDTRWGGRVSLGSGD